jgi:hypothetical protein
MNRIKIYCHVVDQPYWKEFVSNKIEMMKSAGLWNAASEIIFCAHGSSEVFNFLKTEDKVRIVMHATSVKPFNEQYTNRTIKHEADATIDNDYILRFHLKGINWVNNADYPKVYEYANLLNYYNIVKWESVIEKLDQGYEAVGVNWVKDPWPHFVGNIWWSNSNYIKKLKLLPEPHTTGFVQQIPGNATWAVHDAESWIGTANPKAWDMYRNTDDIGFHPDIKY